MVRDDLVERTARAAEASGFAGVNIIPAILPGRSVRAIADYTRRVAADLVVVGSHARRSVSHWLQGSFAAALGNAVASPTITVPTGGPQRTDATAPFRTILCAIDFSEASLLALSEALVLAQQSGGKLRVLHVLNGFPYQTVSSVARISTDRELPARIARVNREVESLIPPAALNWSEVEVATVAVRLIRRSPRQRPNGAATWLSSACLDVPGSSSSWRDRRCTASCVARHRRCFSCQVRQE